MKRCYECLDARDDFHAQLRKGRDIQPSWAPNADTLDVVEDDVVGDEFPTDLDLDAHLNEIGKRERKRRLDMAAIGAIMTRTRWADLELRTQHLPSKALDTALQPSSTFCAADQVRVVDRSYLERSYRSSENQRIVVRHASNPHSEQLKMYIGGMGGTGKTQVLKAIVQYFKSRNEAHRFVVVAPTGSAAALLAGSTYHYMFGLNEQSDDHISNVQLAQLKSRLEGVDYVFLDEVSMLLEG